MQIDCYCNTVVSMSSKILMRFTVHVPRSTVKTQNMKIKNIIDSNMKTFYVLFKKTQNIVNRIRLQWSGFIETLDMIITGPTNVAPDLLNLIKFKAFNKMWTFSNWISFLSAV